MNHDCLQNHERDARASGVGNATRLAVQGAAIGAAFIPVVGWGISLGIGVGDLIWGNDFYNWIDKP